MELVKNEAIFNGLHISMPVSGIHQLHTGGVGQNLTGGLHGHGLVEVELDGDGVAAHDGDADAGAGTGRSWWP